MTSKQALGELLPEDWYAIERLASSAPLPPSDVVSRCRRALTVARVAGPGATADEGALRHFARIALALRWGVAGVAFERDCFVEAFERSAGLGIIRITTTTWVAQSAPHVAYGSAAEAVRRQNREAAKPDGSNGGGEDQPLTLSDL